MTTFRVAVPNLLLMAILWTGLGAGSALASLSVSFQFNGKGNWSLDGVGSNDTPVGNVSAFVPPGSTIVQAYLYCSRTPLVPAPTTFPTISFDGTVYGPGSWTALGVNVSGFGLQAFRADVTAQVAAKIGSGSTSTNSFSIDSEDLNSSTDGEALTIIYSNPAEQERTIAFLDGFSESSGDSTTFTFASPLVMGPGFESLMSLGIGFGFQPSGQFSQVDINGRRLTTSAGGQDDGGVNNGELITIGGIDDNPSNPTDPFATDSAGPRADDELYDLALGNGVDPTPFLSNGDTSFLINTLNPSHNDNIFFLGINVTARGVVSTGLAVTKTCGVISNVVYFSGIVTNSGNAVLTGVFAVDDSGTSGPGDTNDDVVVFGPTTLNPGEGGSYSGNYIPAGCGVFTNTVTARGTSTDTNGVPTELTAVAKAVCEIPCPTCPTCDGTTVVVDQNVTINFNTNPPTYSGDPDLLPYFTYDNSGPTPDTWKAIFDVVGKQLVVKSGATIKTTQVPANTNNRRAPGIVIKSTCTMVTEPDSYITVGSLNRQAGDILIQVDGNITITGVVSNSVDGTQGRPGSITIGTVCGDIVTGPNSKIITYGQDFGGSDINIASCESGNIAISGLVDASYKAKQASTIKIASFGGNVFVDGRNPFGTEVVAGTLRTVTSGVSVRSRRDPLPGTIEIQAASDIIVVGSTLLSKLYPNYGAVAVKTMSNSSKGGLIDVRAGGNVQLTDHALDNANRYNTAAVTRALAGGGIGIQVSASIDNGASNNSKAAVNTQGGSSGQGGQNELRGEGTGVSVGAGAKVLADSTGPHGSVGVNILSGCTGVSNAGVVSPADGAGDNIGVCGTPDPLFLDCSDLGL